jgi:hypothetical protein
MADGYRIIAAGDVAPISATRAFRSNGFCETRPIGAISGLSPLPQVAWQDCVPRYQVPVFPGER